MEKLTRRDTLRLSVASAGAAVLPGALFPEIGESPPINTRVLWGWDQCAEWELNRLGAQTFGCQNPYTRGSRTFVDDYTRILKWCGKHGIDAVVVWGLLRSFHGGVESVKTLCDIAARNNVRLLCGVGLNSYGGVFYEGDSPYSLERHLQSHPELMAKDSGGRRIAKRQNIYGPNPSLLGCPSKPENQDFMAKSLEWLFKNLPLLGGVQIETGDTGVCQCPSCVGRRKYPATTYSWEDMALLYPLAAQAVRDVSPDAWIFCETYAHPEVVPLAKDAAPENNKGRPPWAEECLEQFPKNVFVQWYPSEYAGARKRLPWTKAGTLDGRNGHRHLLRMNYGTYWDNGIRGELAVDWIADAVAQGLAHGFEGSALFSDVSPFHAGSELNYLALQHFGSAANPKADLDLFLKEVAGPLLGGEDHARDFLKHARCRNDRSRIPLALKDIYARIGRLPPESARRWTWLAQFLASCDFQP